MSNLGYYIINDRCSPRKFDWSKDKRVQLREGNRTRSLCEGVRGPQLEVRRAGCGQSDPKVIIQETPQTDVTSKNRDQGTQIVQE